MEERKMTIGNEDIAFKECEEKQMQPEFEEMCDVKRELHIIQSQQ